jgi:hypothetical protein
VCGHGIKDGVKETERGTSMDDKYVLQYSYERRKIHPYEKTKIWYYGPKLDHMKEVKDDSKRKTKKIRASTKSD